MKLSRLIRSRARAERWLVLKALRSDLVRSRLGRSRADTVGGDTCDDEIAVILGLEELVNGKGADVRGLLPSAARLQLARSVLSADGDPPSGVRTRKLELPGPGGKIHARAYEPEGLRAPSPGVVFFHGGGWVSGDLDSHDTLCRRIAVWGRFRVIAIDYRCAPETAFPGAVEDSLAAYRWVAGHAGELGIDPKKIVVAGDSAGGNLSAVVSLKTRKDPVPPALQVLIYPATDATRVNRPRGDRWFLTNAMIEWYLGHYVGSDSARRAHVDVSPLLADDVSGAPPALVYTAGFDPLKDEGEAYAEKLRAAGVSVKYRCFERLIHGFTMMGGISTASWTALEELISDMSETIRRAPETGKRVERQALATE
jgi:acetyl esterase